jgi:hypothetical protein
MISKEQQMTETKTEERKELHARDLLDEKHPVHKHFVAWLAGKEATKRQARKFLQAFPQYRG